jgi:hypothetical protein
MGEVTTMYNLDRPAGARKFLREIRFGATGDHIDKLVTNDGRQVSIDEATDKEVVVYAKQLSESLGINARWKRKIR